MAAFAFGALLALLAIAQPAHGIVEADRVRLREAYRLADPLGDRIWPGWHDAPFARLLVTPEYEYLVRHRIPSPEFTSMVTDTLLGGLIHYPKRVYSTAMQATFPGVNGVNTIVIGQAELTESKTPTRWMLNYPFPYDSVRVQEKFTAMTHALLDALAQTDQPAPTTKTAAFIRTRGEFRASLPPGAEKYFASPTPADHVTARPSPTRSPQTLA